MLYLNILFLGYFYETSVPLAVLQHSSFPYFYIIINNCHVAEVSHQHKQLLQLYPSCLYFSFLFFRYETGKQTILS
jgi:hypothetical protein